MSGASSERARPMAPHVQVWRWHLTMFGSILHRATGIALYAGALVATAWAASLAGGPERYARFLAIAGSIPGKLVLLGLTFSAFYHLANGVRHLVWDFGRGFAPRTANASGAATLAFAVVATVAIWVFAFMTGAA